MVFAKVRPAPGLLMTLVLLGTLAGCGTGVGVGATPTIVSSPTVEVTQEVIPDVTSQPAITEPAATDTQVPEAATPTTAAVLLTAAAEPSQAVEPSATPSGGRVLYVDKDGATIKSVGGMGGNAQTVMQIVGKAQDTTVSSLSASPDGHYIVYGLATKDYEKPTSYHLLEGGTEKTVFDGRQPPVWSPDGKQLALPSFSVGEQTIPIQVLDVVSGHWSKTEAKGTPDWFPDGKRLVYADGSNVFSYDLAARNSVQLTHLPNDDNNAWVVQEAHVLPQEGGIVFYGGQFKKDGDLLLGAQGNGQQWWAIPAKGGEPAPKSEPGGNFSVAYSTSPRGDRLAYSESAHSSACVSVQSVAVVALAGSGPWKPAYAEAPELAERGDGAASVQGLSWSWDGAQVAFGVEPYTCPESGSDLVLGTPIVYVWSVPTEGQGSAQAPRKLVEGTFPVWLP